MNAMLMAAHARGMGAIDWDSIINQGFGFGNQFLTQWGNRAAYRSGINPNAPGGGYLPTSHLTPVATSGAPAGGVGFGLDSQGIRLSDGSHIGWTPIVLGIGALFLLQSPGFSRRGR